MSRALYDRDFYAWTTEQTRLLRTGKLSEADLEHIIREIESLGLREKRELIILLTVFLLHLLKWEFQPMRRGASWRLSIANTRDALTDHMADNPSLQSILEASIDTAYRRARRDAALETGLAESTFSASCPWSFGQMMAEDFWPEA